MEKLILVVLNELRKEWNQKFVDAQYTKNNEERDLMADKIQKLDELMIEVKREI